MFRTPSALSAVVILGVASCAKPPPPPPPPPPPDPLVFVELALGSEHACARTEDGLVYCWGSNGFGQCANRAISKQVTPRQVQGLGRARQIAAGGRHTCAVLDDDSIKCWGGNQHGQLGDDTTENKYEPTTVRDGSTWVSVAAGGDQTCARKRDGTVHCWGESQPGASVKTPMPVMGLAPMKQVSVGLAHACARDEEGTVRCWGENYKRQLGVGKKDERGATVTVADLQASELALGREHSCARDGSGKVLCWGGGMVCVPGERQIGRIVAVKPAPVPGMEKATQIASGGDVTCAVLADGTVGCAQPEQKDGSCTTLQVPGVTGVAVVGVGDGFACALERGGTRIQCWGIGRSGQLGDGKAEDHKTPEPIKFPIRGVEAD
jgi:alpha-tubulin suppressor-like RCC1 family protein